jgi:beta-mannosidase
LVYLTQLLQAEAMRIGVEHWRRNRDCTAGAIYWQLNDCWPVASWASIDYFGRWKALQYVARRFFEPVLLSAEDWGTHVTLHLTNDRNEAWAGSVRWSLETLAGRVLSSGEEEVEIESVASKPVRALALGAQVTDGNRREVVLVHELWEAGTRVSVGVVPFVRDKHLELADPALSATVREAAGGIEIDVSAEQLARFVWLELDGADVIFSDNYFDLPAGRTATVTFAVPDGWDLQQVCNALRVRSLVDSY